MANRKNAPNSAMVSKRIIAILNLLIGFIGGVSADGFGVVRFPLCSDEIEIAENPLLADSIGLVSQYAMGAAGTVYSIIDGVIVNIDSSADNGDSITIATESGAAAIHTGIDTAEWEIGERVREGDVLGSSRRPFGSVDTIAWVAPCGLIDVRDVEVATDGSEVHLTVESGMPVYASDAGTVVDLGYHPVRGFFVVVQHEWAAVEYSHLQVVNVAKGGRVLSGERLGKTGTTGATLVPKIGLRLLGRDERFLQSLFVFSPQDVF